MYDSDPAENQCSSFPDDRFDGGLVDQICRQCRVGKARNARMSLRASSSIWVVFGCTRSIIRTSSATNCASMCSASGRAKIVGMIEAAIS